MKITARTKIEVDENSKPDTLSVQFWRISREEMIVLLAAVILSIFVHGFFVMDGFGEPDAARMAVQAAGWHEMGILTILSYPVRVSPLYLYLIKAVLDLGLPFHSLANFMNWSSVIIGALILIPLYLFWSYLTTAKAAAVGCLLYSFTPIFWHSNTYSMPNLPALGFFVCALLLFAVSLRRSDWRFAYLMGGSAIFASMALGLKADIILCFGAFFGIVVCLKLINLRNIIFSLLIPFIALLLFLGYSKLIVPSQSSAAEFAVTWQRRFFAVNALSRRTNIMGPIAVVGACFFSVFVLSMLYCIFRRANLRLLGMALLWGLPGMIFSSFWIGNAPRHLMASCSVLMFLVAVVFVSLIKKMRWALTIIMVLLLLNNYVSPQKNARFHYGNRLITPINQMQKSINVVRKAGRTFAALPDRNKIIVGTWSIPYVVWEVLADAEDFEIKWHSESGVWAAWAENMEIRAKRKDDSVHTIRMWEVWGRPVRITQPKDWRLWTCESHIDIVEGSK